MGKLSTCGNSRYQALYSDLLNGPGNKAITAGVSTELFAHEVQIYRGFQVACQTAQAASAKSIYVK